MFFFQNGFLFLHRSAPCCRGGKFPVKKDEKEQMGLGRAGHLVENTWSIECQGIYVVENPVPKTIY